MAEVEIDRSEPHFRIYDHRAEGPVVVCVQDFDYPDYDEGRFQPGEWLTEAEANAALRDREAQFVLPSLARFVGRLVPEREVAAAESRGRAAGYADAVRALSGSHVMSEVAETICRLRLPWTRNVTNPVVDPEEYEAFLVEAQILLAAASLAVEAAAPSATTEEPSRG